MKTWMKVAIGCFAVAMIATFLLIAGVVGLGYFAKNKLKEVAEGGAEVQEARKTANAVAFTRPADDLIPEARLVKYIEIRSNVYSVYEKYRGEIESRLAKVKDGKPLDFGDISTGFTFVSELQKAEALALAKHGMSEDEYAFITGEVSKTMWFEMGPDKNGRKALEEAARASANAMKGIDTSALPSEARDEIKRAGAEIAAGQRQAAKEISSIRSAPENEALFKKYETELRKYAMPGMNILAEAADKKPTASTPESK